MVCDLGSVLCVFETGKVDTCQCDPTSKNHLCLSLRSDGRRYIGRVTEHLGLRLSFKLGCSAKTNSKANQTSEPIRAANEHSGVLILLS